MCEPVFQNLPHSYTWPSKKNGPIHILDHPKCWPIHILPFDILYPFFAGYYTNITVSSCNTKRISSLEKSLSEKYVHISGCQKNGAFHTGIQKNWAIHILFVEKKGPIIYLAVLKKGAIRHAHLYYAIYRKLPPAPLPRGQVLYQLSDVPGWPTVLAITIAYLLLSEITSVPDQYFQRCFIHHAKHFCLYKLYRSNPIVVRSVKSRVRILILYEHRWWRSHFQRIHDFPNSVHFYAAVWS